MEACAACPLVSSLQVKKMQPAAARSLCDDIPLLDSPPNFLPTTPSAPSSPENCLPEAVPKLETASMSKPEDVQPLGVAAPGIKLPEQPPIIGTEVTQAMPAVDRAVPFCLPAQSDEAGMDLAPFVELDRMFQQTTDTGEIPGLSYIVLKHGKLVKSGVFGVADTETKMPWRFDSICRMYSMTKTVSVCGLMMLVEEGSVSLEDPVSKFLPNFEFATLRVVHDESVASSTDCKPVKCPVLIKHLLTHTAGLSYGPALGDPPSSATEEAYDALIQRTDRKEFQDLAAWCDELTAMPLRFQPGEKWEYSYSIDIIGRIIEIVSGQRLDHFLCKRVMEPLGMQDTTFALPKAKQGRLTSFYRRVEGKLELVDTPASSQWVEPNQQQVLCAGGTVGSVAGGLVSTINDFARLCVMLQSGGEFAGVRLLKEQTVRIMSSNMLPEVTGRSDCWCLETAGLGFGPLGSVAVEHPDANWFDRPGEIGWGGLAGTAWATDQQDGLVVISFCQVMYELWIDEEVRKATRRALGYAPREVVTASQELKEEARPSAVEERKEELRPSAVKEHTEDAKPFSEVAPDAANVPHAKDSHGTHSEGNHNTSQSRMLSLELGSVTSPLRTRSDVLTRQFESDGADADGEKTPKRPRLSADAMRSQRSTEKLKADDSGETSVSPFTGLMRKES